MIDDLVDQFLTYVDLVAESNKKIRDGSLRRMRGGSTKMIPMGEMHKSIRDVNRG